jgi:6-phosphogluconolactonase (cycloisomerase 2 family)
MTVRRTLAVYRSIGERLLCERLDAETGELVHGGALSLGEPIEYAWPHPMLPLLYVICGHRGADKRHLRHILCVCRFDVETGALHAHAEPVRLAARPIHVSVDPKGEFVLIAYNDPSSLTVHPIGVDGTAGAPLPTSEPLDTGIYAHHVQAIPDGGNVLLVARGNSATDTQAEDPGALKLFGIRDGALANLASIAPNGGYGFGPRDVEFHRTRPWCYVSVERQNRLQLFRVVDGTLESAPAFDVSTLADPDHVEPRQLVGTLHIHPNGRFVYVANRADDFVAWQGRQVFRGGENSIAVFSIDQATGKPLLIQSEDTRSIFVRTFAVDPGGRFLVAASTREIAVRDGARVVTRPAALSIFRIGADGRLQFVRKYDVETRRDEVEQQWVGLIDLAAYARV